MPKFIKKEELDGVATRFKYGNVAKIGVLIKAAEKLEVGDAFKITSDEYPYTSGGFSAAVLNSHFKKQTPPKKFTMRSLEARKGFVFIRIK